MHMDQVINVAIIQNEIAFLPQVTTLIAIVRKICSITTIAYLELNLQNYIY